MNQNTEPSLQNPTWDYLFNNYRLIDLRKHCRELGIRKIWVTKAKLVDLIMEKTPNRSPEEEEQEENENDEDDVQNSSPTNNHFHQLVKDMENFKEISASKDALINDLNAKLRVAINTIDELTSRITRLENNVTQISNNQTSQSHSTSQTQGPLPLPERTLLLGDGNLSHILPSDLKENCSIRTIDEANIDVIKCWVSEMLSWAPTKCVLYCGAQDLIDGTPPITILDGMGALVSSLKEKNENMTIHICEIIPTLDGDEGRSTVNDFNSKLIEWSFNNNINIIKTDLPFKTGTGDLDDLCIDANQETCPKLNRFGVIRLLNTISKQYPSLDMSICLEKLKQNKNNYRKPYVNSLDRMPKKNNQNRTYVNNNNTNEPYNRTTSALYDIANYHPHASSPSESPPFTHTDFINKRQVNMQRGINREINHTQRRSGCFNCGEYNHHHTKCRFDHKLKCGNCGRLGHKSRLCNKYYK